MMATNGIRCETCGSADAIPIQYGIKQPRRDTDLSLQRKLKLLPKPHFGLGAPLWYCPTCDAGIAQPGLGVGESDEVSTLHFESLDALFNGYVELSDVTRERLHGKKKLEELLPELEIEAETQFDIVRSDEGATVFAVGATKRRILDCDLQTFRQLVAFCDESTLVKRNHTTWSVSRMNNADGGVCLLISRDLKE
jgi:hypothetical protein